MTNDPVITVFRSRLREEYRSEYEAWAERMDSLARTMPGFRSIKTFHAADGERVSIVEFDSEECSSAWRDHPDHRMAQALGRERFYAEYEVSVCRPLRRRRHPGD